jgi:hypothetical protein
MGAPYALSSDLVSAWPAKSLEVAQYIDGQVPLLAMTQNAQTGTTYTLVAADFTRLVTLSNASPVAVTLPTEATASWPAGTQLRLLNQGAGTVTVAGAVGVTINGTPLTLTQYKGAALIKTGTNTWTFVPFASGSAKATVTATTGSPTITTVGSKTYYQFTGSGTATLTAGTLRVMVQAGGGGGNSSRSGGAGGQITRIIEMAAGTYTVTIGAGGNLTSQGTASQFDSLYSVGGGCHGFTAAPGGLGFGGSGSATTTPTGKNVPAQGNIGASGAGGGGGAGGAATGATPSGIGGVGIAFADGNTYGTGGSEATGGAGATNRGNGGQGSSNSSGGSGMVVLEIE